MRKLLFPLLLAPISLVACDDSSDGSGGAGSTSGTTTSTTTTTTTTTTASGSSSSSGMVCPGPGFGGNEVAVSGGSISATIVDGSGPVANQPIFICGIDLCTPPSTTNASGVASLTTTIMMKKPAFKFGDALTYPEFVIDLPGGTSEMFGTLTIAPFPATGEAIVAGATATSNDVELTVPAGGTVDIDPFIYETPEQRQFKAVPIPVAGVGPVVDAIGTGFELLYGVSPAESRLCPAADLSVPNTPGWTAGAAVEFWAMTIDAGQEYAPYGGWAKVSDGAVSADGMRVETTGGILLLENFAVRLKP